VELRATIGLEVHVELHTKSKLFCSCSTAFGSSPNSQVCPVCMGLPGVLPVINKKAVEYLVRVAHALHCHIARTSKFDRKNYFYPDMPKNFQISQYDLPLAQKGYLTLVAREKPFTVGITRIHLEEDTGKSTHMGTIDRSLYTLEDYNRAGVPLLEIVTEPDMTSPEEASLFISELRHLVKWLDVSDCKMEEGSLRCDANISVSAVEGVLGTKTEIKNMNSIKSVRDALEYEIKRQQEVLAGGGAIVQETRGWDENKCITISMRSKEEEHDYRYFPEPDLVPLRLEKTWIEAQKAALPELPSHRKTRFIQAFSLPEYDAEQLTASRELADFFEATVELCHSPKLVSNWLMGDVSRALNEKSFSIEHSPLSPTYLASILGMLEKGTINGNIAKQLVDEVMVTGKDPSLIVKERGWFQISDEDELLGTVRTIVRSNPDALCTYRGGNEKVLGFLMGQVMKYTRGKANPEVVNRMLREECAHAEEKESLS
jgi:aspartyl-tRNA(Asn)/glutamyl-tRNA(Gln) amidotransferase subunit B